MNFDTSVLQVAIEDIIPNRFQPRLAFEDSSLNDLASSIKEHGIIQPLVLRRIGEKYEIVAGERRYKAARMAGLTSVPAVISLIDDKKSAEIAIAENVQRKELTAIEEAKSYKALLDQGYMSEEQLAKKMGLPVSAIINKLKLLSLAPEVQSAVMEGKISERHARSLLDVTDTEEQIKWLNRIVNERMTVRVLDNELRKEYGANKMNVDINEVKQNATDIPVIAPMPTMSQNNGTMDLGPINLGQKQSNKFFNNLEDQAVNMQMTEAINPFIQNQTVSTDNNGFSVASVDNSQNIAPASELSSESIDSLDFAPTPVAKDFNQVKSKLNGLMEEFKSLGYNINITNTELSDKITFTIEIN